MGWWDESIMGGDAPLDVQIYFEEQRINTSDEAVAFIEKMINHWNCYENVIKHVVGFLMIKNGHDMSDQLRQLVIDGIEAECEEEALLCWTRPDIRRERLMEFKLVVLAYPAEGGKVELPDQPGLFDKIFG